MKDYDEPKLNWERQSWKRHSAKVGPLRIEVVKGQLGGWRIGELFGNQFAGHTDGEMPILYAKVLAE